MKAQEAVRLAWQHHTIIPAFNIPYLPMVEPVVQAIVDENSVAMVQVARLEWEKFESQSPEAVAKEYFRFCKEGYTLLHLDHIPAIDEDQKNVDFLPLLKRALEAGYQSVMIDGSRLPLAQNIAVTRQAAELAAKYGSAVEAELGAVAGHEGVGIGLSYEELFTSKKGFTKTEEAAQFARESGCDWLLPWRNCCCDQTPEKTGSATGYSAYCRAVCGNRSYAVSAARRFRYQAGIYPARDGKWHC